MKKRILSLFLALCMVVGMLPTAWAVDTDTGVVNLARLDGVVATDNNHEEGTRSDGTSYNFNGAKAIDGIKTGGEHDDGHWSTDAGTAARTLQLDLMRMCEVTEIKLFWKHDSVTAYTLEVSGDGQTWTEVHEQTGRVELEQTVTLDSPVQDVRYVKLTATAYDNQGTAGWANVNLWEIEVYGTAGAKIEPPTGDTPSGNLCRPSDGAVVSATASAQDATTHGAAKAVDGDMTTRWASETAASTSSPQWLQIDLGAVREISIVKLYWEQTSVLAYTLQVSENGTTWTTVHERTSRLTQVDETLTFDPVNARYVKVNVTAFDNKGSLSWPSVSLWEVEVYKDETSLPKDVSGILSDLTFGVVNDKVVVTSEVPDDVTVTFAANLEQVVGPDGTVYQPLVDTRVELDVTVTADDGTTASSPANSPVALTIMGSHSANQGNEKPAVIPEIAEWYSSASQNGQMYFLSSASRIIAPAELSAVAAELKADMKDLFGLDLTIAIDGTPFSGDIVLALGTGDKVAGFDNETYLMEVTDQVTITGTDAVGVYWGTRTVLQSLKLSDWLTIPQGTARDYPEFRLRGFTLDVGRKPISMDMLKQIAKNMAWYKLNDFHVHLSDNLIFMEDYGVNSNNYTDPDTYAKANDAYSAFRLESDLEEEEDAVAPLSAKDYHYTKAEFKQFTEESAVIGVNIVPEIDVPAHAKAITDAFPSLRLVGASGHPWNDHLDLTNKYDASLAKVQEIFDEYIDGGVFGSTVHFGADEYYDSHPAYRHFVKDMIAYLKEKGDVTPRLWASLTAMSSGTDYQITKEEAEGVQMNIWSTGWANPQQMYNMGFDLINITDNPCYMVPNGGGGRGGYGDYLNLTSIYSWTPNYIGGTWLPASSSQILGGSFAIWQDNIDTRAAGIDEVDTFVRFYDTLPVISVKMWGEGRALDRTLAELQADAETIGYAPNTNAINEVSMKNGTTQYFKYDFADASDKSGNGRNLTLTGAELTDGALELTGGASYAEIGLDRMGWNNKLSFKVNKTSGGGTEQVIFEGDHAYGDFAIKALPVADDDTKWKLGFSRELYDYEFDVELPVGEWVTLTLVTSDSSTRLFVNDSDTGVNAVGAFQSDENSNTPFWGKTGITHASFQLPLARIGSKTNAFVGLVDDVFASVASFGTPVDDGEYDIPITEYASVDAGDYRNNEDSLPINAIDGDTSTLWHTQWSSKCPDEDGWIQIELEERQTVSSLRYLPRASGTNGIIKTYDILVSDDGETWTTVLSNGSFASTSGWQVASFPAVETKFVRLLARDTLSDANYRYVSAAEIRICRAPDLSESGKTIVSLAGPSYALSGGKAEPEPTVTFGGLPLEKDKDYTLSYENNTRPGTATVIVTGAGSYVGSVSATFKVTAESLSGASVTFSQTSYPLVDGKAEPQPTVTLNGVVLVKDQDYTLAYANNTAAGTATVTVTGIGSYRGTVTATFTVTTDPQPTTIDLSGASVAFDQESYLLVNGRAEPQPTVTLDGVVLVKDRDYTLTYANNTEAGTGVVIIDGIGDYSGSVTATFTITVDPTAIDLSGAVITFSEESYPLSGGKAEPQPTVTLDGVVLVKDRDYTLTYANNTAAGTGIVIVTGIGDYTGSVRASFTITDDGGDTPNPPEPPTPVDPNPPAPVNPTPTTPSTGSTVETGTLPDGAALTTTTDKETGAVSAEAKYEDGTVVTSETNAKGGVTAEVVVPDSVDKVTVIIPTDVELSSSQVAVIVHPDGTEEVVRTSIATEGGMQVTLTESAILRIVDNGKVFTDVPSSHWASDAIAFVTSRGIFNGTGSGTFTPNSGMSRAMVCTVLANLAGQDVSGGATWYEKAVDWAKAMGLSDGTNPNAVVTREQLATMLYRYAGSPAVTSELPARYTDGGQVSEWAEAAMAWAVENEIINGRSSTQLAPKSTATRAEVAAILQRSLSKLV